MQTIIDKTKQDSQEMYEFLGIDCILENITDEEKEKYKELIIFENKLLKKVMNEQRKIPDTIQEPKKIDRSYSVNSFLMMCEFNKQSKELKRLGFNNELERNKYFYENYTEQQKEQIGNAINKCNFKFSDITIRRINREFKKYSFDEVLYCWEIKWYEYLNEHNSIESVIENLITIKHSNEDTKRKLLNENRELKCIYCALFLKKYSLKNINQLI